LPEPGEASGDPGVKTATLKAAILARGVTVESVDDLDGALGMSSGGHIRLLNGLSPATEFTTLVREYAHLWTGSGYVRLFLRMVKRPFAAPFTNRAADAAPFSPARQAATMKRCLAW
jgi:hypothetical protein